MVSKKKQHQQKKGEPASDYLLEALLEQWDNIWKAYRLFENKDPIVLFDIQEQRIYVNPHEDFKSEMKPKSQVSLAEQYEQAKKVNQIVVFVRDNDKKRLVCYSMDYE
jgi:hypothetical protein